MSPVFLMVVSNPFGPLLLEVLLYAQSTMFKPSSFWPKIAMKENILLGHKSPYTRYLLKWKQATDSLNFDPKRIRASVKKAAITNIMSQQRATSTSSFAMSPPGSSPANQWFRPKPWVTDSCLSQLFSQFRSCNAGFGNRGPAKDGKLYKLCPLCAHHGLKSINNEVRLCEQKKHYQNILNIFQVHVIIDCPIMEPYRSACDLALASTNL